MADKQHAHPHGFSPQQEPPRRHLVFFVILALLLLLPYFYKYIPGLEKRFNPGQHTERLGDKAVEAKQYKQALAKYRTSLTQTGPFSRPRSKREKARVNYKIAFCHIYLRQPEIAITYAEKAIALYKWPVPIPYEMLLHLYAQKKRMKKVASTAKRYVKRFPTSWRTFFSIGNIYAELKARKQALRYYSQGLKHAPGHPALLNAKAWVITNSSTDPKRLQEAIELAEQARKASPTPKFVILNTLAEAHWRLGHTKRAKILTLKSIQHTNTPREKAFAQKRLKALKRYPKGPAPEARKPAPTSRPTPRRPASRPTVARQATSRPTPRRPTTSRPSPRAQPASKPSRPPIPQLRFAPVPIPRAKPHRRSRRLIPLP